MEVARVRHADWPLRLSAFLQERQKMDFVWGENDCMIFCSDAVLRLTGQDPAAEIRGTYNDLEGALGVIAGYGENVEAIIEAKLGQSKPKGFANRGDIATYEHNGLICGGVVDDTGRRAAFVMPEKGLTRIPLKLCKRVWGY